MRLARALVASAALLIASVQADQFADGYSTTDGNFNLSAIYDSSTSSTSFTLTSLASGSALGWLGVGTGSGMAGSNMVVLWSSNNQLVTTQRTASGNNQPTTAGLPLAAMQVNSSMTKTGASGTTVNWVQPGFPTPGSNMQQVEMIWASSPSAPSSSDAGSSLSMHNNRNKFTFDLTQPYNGGSVATTGQSAASSAGGSDHTLNKYNNIVIAHMVFMIAGWLLIFPAGVFLARFGRTAMIWFPKHRAVQISGIVVVFIGLFLGFGIMWDTNSKHFKHLHHTLGLALVLLAIFQGLLGQVGHMIFRAKGVRIQNFLHMLIGIAIIPLATWEMGMGFDLWDWKPPHSASIVLYAWAGFLGLVYILGMAFGLPKEARTKRARKLKNAQIIDRTDSEDAMLETAPQDKVMLSHA